MTSLDHAKDPMAERIAKQIAAKKAAEAARKSGTPTKYFAAQNFVCNQVDAREGDVLTTAQMNLIGKENAKALIENGCLGVTTPEGKKSKPIPEPKPAPTVDAETDEEETEG